MKNQTLKLISETEVEIDNLQLEGAISPDKWMEKRCYLRSLSVIVHDVDEPSDGQSKVLEKIQKAIDMVKNY